MEWLGLALVPMVLCGAMCAGGALLAAIGLRKRNRRSRANSRTAHADRSRVDAETVATR